MRREPTSRARRALPPAHEWPRALRGSWRRRAPALELSVRRTAVCAEPVEEGRADFIPIFLSDIPGLFSQGIVPLDVALLSLSPPDRHGNCTLGTSVDAARAAADSARIVIAEINEQMPRTHGNTVVALDRLHAFTLTDRPLWEAPRGPTDGDGAADRRDRRRTSSRTARRCRSASAASPTPSSRACGDKHDLGVHTEMFSDGLIDLIESGVVTNRLKEVHRGRTVTSFVSGTRATVRLRQRQPAGRVPCAATAPTTRASSGRIRRWSRSTPRSRSTSRARSAPTRSATASTPASAGRWTSSAAPRSRRAASRSWRCPSTAAGGHVTRIVAALKPGAGVVTTRGHVHWVVTEYGAVNLHGLTLRQRAEALISIAHPDFRAELRRDAMATRHFVLAG